MATSTATTPDEYIASLPDDRRETVAKVVDVIRDNLPDGYEEGMAYGMIGWWVPLERFPDTYNRQPLGLAGLASQKNYISLYLNSVYGDAATERWFKQQYAASGKTLNMGKSCVRFKRLEDIPLDVIARRSRALTSIAISRTTRRRAARRARRARQGAEPP
jgi:hypothetical protein